MTYCICGNEENAPIDENGEPVGPLCKPFLKGPLLYAYEAWTAVRDEWGKHCAGVSSDIAFGRTLEARIIKSGPANHLYMHPNSHGESVYYSPTGLCSNCEHQHNGADDMCVAPADSADEVCPCNKYVPPFGTRPTIEVECGVWFYADHAQPYWIFDTESESTGMEFGDPVPYSLGRDEFLAGLEIELDNAAYHAWLSDYAQCKTCGSHYYFPNGPCCEDEDAEESA